MADIAELGIKIDAKDGITTVKELDRSLDHLGQQQQKLSNVTVASTRNMNAWNALQAEAVGHTGEHSLAIGRLERALAGIVGHFVGAGQAAELLASGLLKFSIGSIETVGILGGVAAIIGIYEQLTEGAREATKQMDTMTKSLVEQSKAAYQATVEGRKNLALIADMNREAVKAESGIGWRSIALSVLTGRPTISGTDAERQAGRLADVQTASDQANANVKEAIDREHEKELARLRALEAERAKQQRLLEAYNAMMEKAYGGILAITPMTSAQRASWLAGEHGRTMSDTESAGVRKLLGPGGDLGSFDAYGNWTGKNLPMPNVGINDALNQAQIRQRKKMGIDLSGGTDDGGIFGGVAGAFSQFAPQALVTSAVTAGINFIASGFMDLASSMFNGGKAAREFALQTKTLKDNLDQAIASFQHNDLAAAIAGIAGQQDALIKQAWDLYGTASYIILHGTKDLAKALDDIAKGAGMSAEMLKRQTQYQQEDLVVRNLRATGQGDAADLLAFREKQQREMQAALDSNKDALYINTLRTTQNNELIAYQNGLLSSALRNAPTGFYGSEAYAGAFATPRGPMGYPTDSGSSSSGLPRISGRTGGTTTIILQVDGKVLTRTVVNNVDQFGAATNGAGTSRSDAFNRYPS